MQQINTAISSGLHLTIIILIGLEFYRAGFISYNLSFSFLILALLIITLTIKTHKKFPFLERFTLLASVLLLALFIFLKLDMVSILASIIVYIAFSFTLYRLYR